MGLGEYHDGLVNSFNAGKRMCINNRIVNTKRTKSARISLILTLQNKHIPNPVIITLNKSSVTIP